MSEHDDAFELDEAAPEPHMAAMLSAYRDEEDMPADAKARVQRRLEAAPVLAVTEPIAASSRGLWIGVAVAAVVAAIIVVPRLGSDASHDSGSSAAYEGARPPSVERAVQPAVEREITAKPERTPDLAPEPEQTAGDGASVDEAVAPVSAGPDAPRRKPAKAGTGSRHQRAEPEPAERLSPADSLAEETALLRRAQASLSDGKPRGALSALREHKQRFSEGVLAEERRALTVVALCDDGQVERGRKEARSFSRKHPGSALQERVAAACPEGSK